jgi:hypothetical protein
MLQALHLSMDGFRGMLAKVDLRSRPSSPHPQQQNPFEEAAVVVLPPLTSQSTTPMVCIPLPAPVHEVEILYSPDRPPPPPFPHHVAETTISPNVVGHTTSKQDVAAPNPSNLHLTRSRGL